MALPASLPSDSPVYTTKRIGLDVPDWIYWQLVSVSEAEQEDLGYMFVLASRAIIADFDAVEAMALRKFVSEKVEEGLSDPKIAALLGIPPRRVRAVRRAYGIVSKVKGRGLRKPAQVKILELAT